MRLSHAAMVSIGAGLALCMSFCGSTAPTGQATATSSGSGSGGAKGTGGAPTSSGFTATSASGTPGACPNPLEGPFFSTGESCADFAVGATCDFGDEPAIDCTCTKSGSMQVWQCTQAGPGTGGTDAG